MFSSSKTGLLLACDLKAGYPSCLGTLLPNNMSGTTLDFLHTLLNWICHTDKVAITPILQLNEHTQSSRKPSYTQRSVYLTLNLPLSQAFLFLAHFLENDHVLSEHTDQISFCDSKMT